MSLVAPMDLIFWEHGKKIRDKRGWKNWLKSTWENDI